MSVEPIQLLQEDYIRLTERFKALWTFHQFLRGVYKTFFPSEPGYELDFNPLYEEVRGIAADINVALPETTGPRLSRLFEKLDAVSATLRAVDRKVSPSFVRRFFERVRPEDEKIAFYLLRFYFGQPDVDEDVIDKVDFLATVAAAGRSDPSASATRPRSAIKKFFETVTAISVWPRLESGTTPAIVRAFDELAADVDRAREFEELLREHLLANVRTMKRRLGNGLSNAEVLTAVAWCNLTTRSVFQRLYEKEERRLDEATGRITNLERELGRGADTGTEPEEFRRFRESRTLFDLQSKDRNLRAQQVLDLKEAIGGVLEKFDISGLEAGDIEEALELVEESDEDSGDAVFWKPALQHVLAAVELYDDGVGPLRTNLAGLAHLRLEDWELSACRKTVAAGGAPTAGADDILLRAAALRVQAEQETEALRRAAQNPTPPETLKTARATLASAAGVDADLAKQIEHAQASKSPEEARWCTRTRFRLLRATSDLWLMLDNAQGERRLR
ncbi:MAG: hypothetical protein ACRD1B_01465 [Thermoanaerobaculia bacterium]